MTLQKKINIERIVIASDHAGFDLKQKLLAPGRVHGSSTPKSQLPWLSVDERFVTTPFLRFLIIIIFILEVSRFILSLW